MSRSLVFFDPSGRQGLLDVQPEHCELRVTAIRLGAGRWRLAAEAFNIINGGSDGWYDFLENYQHNADENVPYSTFCPENGWIFPTQTCALATAKRWAKEIGVQHKVDFSLFVTQE